MKEIEERWRYTLVGMALFGVSTTYNVVKSAPSWEGEWLTDNLGQIIVAMIGGALLGRFVFWLRNRKPRLPG